MSRLPAFTEEQEQLRHYVRRFMGEVSAEAAVRVQMQSAAGYDPAVWSAMATKLGLQAIVIPERFGGQGYGSVELGIVLEEMGRALYCGPYLSSVVLVAQLLLLSCDEILMQRHLPAIAAGERLACLATLDDAGHGLKEIDMPAQARASGSDWLIDGEKVFVIDGHLADLIVVSARTVTGTALFLVDGAHAGIERSPMTTLDMTRRLARLRFTATPALRIADEQTAPGLLDRLDHLASIALAAEQVGGAQRCLEMAVDYAKLRRQFGRPIGSFQAIKHKCADLLVQVESARSVAYFGGWCAARNSEQLPKYAAIAKSYCSEVYFNVAAENIQVHGGIGFTWEHPAQLYFKRAKSSELMFGTPQQHRSRLAEICAI